MPYGLEPLQLERFCGLNTQLDPTNLPVYMSPDCQDVAFTEGLVQTRPGTSPVFPAMAGNPTVNYLKTYINSQQQQRMLTLDSNALLYKEVTQGFLNQLVNPGNALSILPIPSFITPGCYANSVSLFNREYMAFGDGKFGVNRPLQYDDTNLDIVTQSGPGIAPTVTDEAVSSIIAAGPTGATQPAAVAIATASETGNIVTITNGAAHGLNAGNNVVIAGVAVAGYNNGGTNPAFFTVLTVISATKFTYQCGVAGLAGSSGGTSSSCIATYLTTTPHGLSVGEGAIVTGVGVGGYNANLTVVGVPDATHFQFNLTVANLAASGGGTVAPFGSIIAGTHQVSVMYQDREGYITRPAPPSSWVASGNKRAVVTGIPVPPSQGFPASPSNIVARILCFTPANSDTFFFQDGTAPLFSGNFIINDATTTSVTVDFSDQTLLSGVNVDDLFDLVELGDCSGVVAYNQRLAFWGERNKMDNWINLGFEGGGSNPDTATAQQIPGGWTTGGTPDVTGCTVQVVYTGTVGYQGAKYHMAQPVSGPVATLGLITQSAVKDYLGDPLILPNTDYSIRAIVSSTAGSGVLHIHLFSASAGINTTGIVLAGGNSTATEIIAQLTGQLASIPTDLLLRVYADGTPTAQFDVYNIQIYPTNQPFNSTVVRISKAPDILGLFGPESYNGVDGFLNVAPDNGQAVRSCFILRNNFYIVKERSMFVTQDDGTNEPAEWPIQEISSKVGTLSVRGVGLGDEWAIIAGQDGVYLFNGGEPQKISQEIQPTWNQINWQYGHLIVVTVDTKLKRAYIQVPFGTSTIPNKTFVLDFQEGFDEATASGNGRKWAPWTTRGNSQALILRDDGTQQLFIGNDISDGNIYQLDSTGTVHQDTIYFPLASDTFDRANENPVNAPWMQINPTANLPQIFSNQLRATALMPQFIFAFYSGPAWPNNQFCKFTVVACTGIGGGPNFFHSAIAAILKYNHTIAKDSWYEAFADDSGNISIALESISNSTLTGTEVILASRSQLINSGDIIQFNVVRDSSGNNILTFLINNIEVLQAKDNSITSGSPGVGFAAATATSDSVLDNWVGGSVPTIDSYWQSGYFQSADRMSYQYISSNVIGSGNLNILLRRGDQGWITNIRPWTLSQLGFTNMERQINMEGSRMAIRIGTNGLGDHFSMQGLTMWARESAYAPFRGINR